MSNNSIKNFLFFNFKKIFKNRKLELHEPEFNQKELSEVKNSIKNKNVSTAGSLTPIFEKLIAKKVNCKFVIATNSGTSALHLALISLGTKKNDEVLMPSLNYIASANACLYIGAIPHFVDIEHKTLGVDVVKLNDYLKKNTTIKNGSCVNKKTKRKISAIICLHTFGHPCEIEKIKILSKKFRLRLIEDAAEALGSFYKKKHLGTFGDIGIISFNGNKIITTGGGGVVLTNNLNLAKKALKLSTISKKKHFWKYEFDDVGYNYRMPSLNSALGIAQIKNLRYFVGKKRKLYKIYEKIFKKNIYFKLFKEPKNSRSNYWLQTILLNKKYIKYRDKIIITSHKDRIKIRPVWRPLHKSKHLKKCPKMNLKNTNDLENRILNLPSSPNLVELLS
jgi:perosamine synthetase